MEKLFLEIAASFIAGGLAGLALFFIYSRLLARKRERELKKEAELILNRARSQAAKIERGARRRALEIEERGRKKQTEESRRLKEDLKRQEDNLQRSKDRLSLQAQAREEEISKREEELKREREVVQIKSNSLEKLKTELSNKTADLRRSAESLAGMTYEEARQAIKNELEGEVKKEISDQMGLMEREMKEQAVKKARLALAQAMARYASEVTAERTMETIPITGSVTKGKIIGREGRNIRALEAACGVDIIIGESQESVNISCFDPVRRAVAKSALKKLMEEGRVHPALIEEITRKTRKEILLKIKEDGEKASFEAGVHDLNPNIVRALGSLHYRFIEGQNLLKYSIESSYIASLLAAEISFDEKKARRAGLLSAIGLAVPHMTGGSASSAGAEFCRKNGESAEVCEAVRRHDGKLPAESILDHVLQCVYNMSRARAGAQREALESQINRMKDLESIANSFDGVIRSYAIKAGREVRVLVDPAKALSQKQMMMMGRDIAGKIRREAGASGDLKVSLIREYRIIEHAR